MRHSIWKLAALVGISGFGFLVLLQVQKSLHDAGATAQAAEVALEGEPRVAESKPTEPAAGPAAGHMAAVPDAAAENPFAGLDSPSQSEPAGLDFREELPAEAPIKGAEIRTAAANLEPVPGTNSDLATFVPSDDPFAEIRDGEAPATSPNRKTPARSESVIQLTGLETPAKGGAKVSAGKAAVKAEPMPAGVSDFGANPFDDLAPLAPNPHAAGLEESLESSPSSPSKLLEEEDPFANPPAIAQPAPKSEPVNEGAAVPIRGGNGSASPVDEDDPFGAQSAEPHGTSTAPDPIFGGPSELNGDHESPGASELDMAPNVRAPLSDPDFDDPPAERPAETPDFGERETPREQKPTNDQPDLLPAGNEEDPLSGIGTVSPNAPRGPQRAELTVEKKAPETAKLGQPLVYEITITNVGDCAAQQVTVSDVIPKGTRLEGSIPQGTMAGQTLLWKLGTLDPGKASKIRVKVIPTEAGSVGSVATVNFVSEVAAKTEVIAPHLSLKVVAQPQVALGQPVDFRFEITNEGAAPAERVLLRDVLPDGFKHPDGNDLEYEVGTLAPGKSESVTLRAAAVKPGNFKNTAVLTAAGGLKTEAAADVEVSGGSVTVTRQGPKRRFVGRPATYANVVKNTSDRTVPGVKVVERVPEGMEFVQASHKGQFDPGTRTIAWQLGSLRPGQSQTLQVILTAASEGLQDSTVVVEEAGGGQVELTSSTAVQGTPSLAPSMQGPDRPISVGERAAYRVVLKNRGNAPAAGVTLALGFSRQIKFVQARGAETKADASGGAVARLAAPIPPGGEQTIEIVIEGAAPGTARVRAEVNASHMTEPLVRDEELIVAPTQ